MSAPELFEDESKRALDGDQSESESGYVSYDFDGDEDRSRKVRRFYFIKTRPLPDLNPLKRWIEGEVERLDRSVDYKSVEFESRRDGIVRELNCKRDQLDYVQLCLESRKDILEFLQEALEKLNSAEKIPTTHESSNLANGLPMINEIDDAKLPLLHEINAARFYYKTAGYKEAAKLLDKIKLIEEEHVKAKADVGAKGELWNPFDSTKFIEEQIKVMNEMPAKELEQERDQLIPEVDSLMRDHIHVEEEFIPSNVVVAMSKKSLLLLDFCMLEEKEPEHHQWNANYSEYVSVISHAKELARMKDVAALEELSHNQVEKFMNQWKNDGDFRLSYKAAIQHSLKCPKLSRDGGKRHKVEEALVPLIDFLVISKDSTVSDEPVVPMRDFLTQ